MFVLENGADFIENTASRVAYRPLRSNDSMFNDIACLLCRDPATDNFFWLTRHNILIEM
jgi:hypothetical protein